MEISQIILGKQVFLFSSLFASLLLDVFSSASGSQFSDVHSRPFKSVPTLQEGSSFSFFGTYYFAMDCTLRASKTSERDRAAQSSIKINYITNPKPGSHWG